jgi:hypothetical protein
MEMVSTTVETTKVQIFAILKSAITSLLISHASHHASTTALKVMINALRAVSIATVQDLNQPHYKTVVKLAHHHQPGMKHKSKNTAVGSIPTSAAVLATQMAMLVLMVTNTVTRTPKKTLTRTLTRTPRKMAAVSVVDKTPPQLTQISAMPQCAMTSLATTTASNTALKAVQRIKRTTPALLNASNAKTDNQLAHHHQDQAHQPNAPLDAALSARTNTKILSNIIDP